MSNPIPADDLSRQLTFASSETHPHVGVVGDTYTVLIRSEDTNGRFSLIDMYVPPGGGPPPHRHDFEETFSLTEGELEFTFRGEKKTVKAGETINVPANAPHQFRNVSDRPARMLCICSPGGQEKMFEEIGVPVATRTTPPPKPTPEQEKEFGAKAKALAPKYRTEMLGI